MSLVQQAGSLSHTVCVWYVYVCACVSAYIYSMSIGFVDQLVLDLYVHFVY